jgi:hypothetical protein
LLVITAPPVLFPRRVGVFVDAIEEELLGFPSFFLEKIDRIPTRLSMIDWERLV